MRVRVCVCVHVNVSRAFTPRFKTIDAYNRNFSQENMGVSMSGSRIGGEQASSEHAILTSVVKHTQR